MCFRNDKKTHLQTYVPSEDSDQSVYLPSLIFIGVPIQTCVPSGDSDQSVYLPRLIFIRYQSYLESMSNFWFSHNKRAESI